MKTTTTWNEVPASSIPANVRFTTPQINLGQIVEVSYGGYGKGEHDTNAPYQRVEDRSMGQLNPNRVKFYKKMKS